MNILAQRNSGTQDAPEIEDGPKNADESSLLSL